MARSKNCLTSFIGDIVGSTTVFVDDMLDGAKGVEAGLCKAARNIYAGDEERERKTSAASPSTADLKAITATLAELTVMVNELTAAQVATAPRRATKSATAPRRATKSATAPRRTPKAAVA